MLFKLDQMTHQKEEVVNIVLPTVKRSSWFAFSECIIQTLLCSKDEEERRQGVKKIVEIRGEGDDSTQVGDRRVRPRKTPEINSHARSLVDLISWEKPVFEPPLTHHLTTLEVKQFLSKPMEVPSWPCHTQSVERCVKQVT